MRGKLSERHNMSIKATDSVPHQVAFLSQVSVGPRTEGNANQLLLKGSNNSQLLLKK